MEHHIFSGPNLVNGGTYIDAVLPLLERAKPAFSN